MPRAGAIVGLLVSEGQAVSAGDLLAKIEPT
jgi:biotin carboxyl carrier protein